MVTPRVGIFWFDGQDRPEWEYAVRTDGMLPCRWLESADDIPHEPMVKPETLLRHRPRKSH